MCHMPLDYHQLAKGCGFRSSRASSSNPGEVCHLTTDCFEIAATPRTTASKPLGGTATSRSSALVSAANPILASNTFGISTELLPARLRVANFAAEEHRAKATPTYCFRSLWHPQRHRTAQLPFQLRAWPCPKKVILRIRHIHHFLPHTKRFQTTFGEVPAEGPHASCCVEAQT